MKRVQAEMRIHKETIDSARFDVVATGMEAMVEKINRTAPYHGQFYVQQQFLAATKDELGIKTGQYVVVERKDDWEWVNLRLWAATE